MTEFGGKGMEAISERAADTLALAVRDARKSYGAVAALDGCSIEVPTGGIVGLIGPNGSGKSTLIEVISGLQELDSGEVLLNGRAVQNLSPHQRARYGLRRSFQVSRLWQNLSVMENILAAMPQQGRDKLWKNYFSPRIVARQERDAVERGLEILSQFGLWRLRNDRASALSGGQGRLLEFARIMVSDASIALLDEPLAGVNPVMAEAVVSGIGSLMAAGISVLVVEHDLSFIESLCDKVYGMESGRVVVSGSMREIAATEFFAETYIGRSTRGES